MKKLQIARNPIINKLYANRTHHTIYLQGLRGHNRKPETISESKGQEVSLTSNNRAVGWEVIPKTSRPPRPKI